MVNIREKGSKDGLEELRRSVLSELKKFPELKSYAKLICATGCVSSEADISLRRRDHISHFILRLAHCRTEDLRRWFINRELELFRLRWFSLSNEGKKKFLQINGLDYKPISDSERLQLTGVSRGMVSSNFEYYQVPFVEVIDLVRKRNVFLKGGYAFITSNDFISVIIYVYRAFLAHELVVTCRKLPQIEAMDERVFRDLNQLPKSYTGKDFTVVDKAEVPIESLDSLSKTSFPMCMQHMHSTLRKEHHLRHGGRQLYGLFLKAIGVTLDDALRFWREEFTQKPEIDHDKFDKQYAYNIRHNYGKEGKRANYTPHSCMKIITESLGTQDQHGCPYKHWDANKLKASLLQQNIQQIDVQEIVDLAKEGHYQLACTRHFEAKHNGAAPDGGVNHPNQYFEQSQAVLRGKQDNSKKETPRGKPMAKTASTSSVKKKKVEEDMWDDADFDNIDF
ncbi:DNA primase large subunit [Nilaparvata lugens]|uniref:DNA primase large subunit n=1 Tax=Nilaparvata lugens TaxID=108931 RepID=UPI00193CFC3C|nr:DNA primase large subunit [Nilaparvata lugens]